MTSEFGAIYLLSDPTTNEIRYVGQATNPSKRFTSHMLNARRGKSYPVYDWIRSLTEKQIIPKLSVLIVMPRNRLDVFEMAYISVMRSCGYRLLNVTNGGSVPMAGRKFTEEHRQKISDANKGKKRTEEQKRQMSESRKGRKLSEETIKKLCEAHARKKHVISDDGKKRISDAMKSRVISDETRRKQSESHMGKPGWKKGIFGIPHPHVGHHVKRNRKPIAGNL